ncbi:hypothetical protein AAHE18_16G120300 [Arachis hypogaea]
MVKGNETSDTVSVVYGDGNQCYWWWWLVHKETTTTFLIVGLFAILVHAVVNNTNNDLSYSGLDYPPLTAYQSFIHGLFLRFVHPKSIFLFTSKGHESYLGKLLMRWTMLSSDLLILFPAVLYFVIVCYGQPSGSRKSDVGWHIALLLLNPCLIIIDHGHFQICIKILLLFYNCISLGFTIGAVFSVLSRKDLVACVLYCLALNHNAYFAPAFFSHLLGKGLRHKHSLLEVSKLRFYVLGNFVDVLSCLAPFKRGIFKDYVANFWCASSIIIKWKRLFTLESLRLLSLIAIVITCLPLMFQQIKSPNNRGFLCGLLNCSFAFYWFSFQVYAWCLPMHEKSILLPLLPASMLADARESWLVLIAIFLVHSICHALHVPLICRDGLVVPYFVLLALFILIFDAPGQQRVKEGNYLYNYSGAITVRLVLFCYFILHIVYLIMNPPEKYHFLFEAIIMNVCFSQFVLVTLGCNIKQWVLNKPTKLEVDKKFI